MIVGLLLLHFIADFILQSREMGKKKSTEFKWLSYHLLIQFAVFLLGLTKLVGFTTALKFSILNALIHGIIDWNIWKAYKLITHKRIVTRLVSLGVYGKKPLESLAFKIKYDEEVKNWQYWEDHLFYLTIGLDQFLHNLTLLILAWRFL